MYDWLYGSTDQKTKEDLRLSGDSHAKRLESYQAINKNYPGWIPILVEAIGIKLNKTQYVIQKSLPFKAFVDIVRTQCSLDTPIDAQIPLLFVTNDTLIPVEDEMGKIYRIHKKNDGFLHITLRIEPI
jgi:hypothetical protein